MNSLTKYFEVPMMDLMTAFQMSLSKHEAVVDKNYLFVKYIKKINGRDFLIPLNIYFKSYRSGTAVYIEYDFRVSYSSFDGDISLLISNVEGRVKKYASFCNLPKDEFGKEDVPKVVTKSEKGEEVSFELLEKEEFENIVNKLISMKKLLDQGIITKSEYNEKTKGLVDKL